MIIGIDIDDTIISTTEALMESFGSSNMILNNIKEAMQNYNIKIPGKVNLEKWFKDVKVKENAVGVVNRLRQKGHKIIFITARDKEHFKDPLGFTIEQLKSFGFSYDKLVVGQMDGKYSACKENGVELMIDDKVSTCWALEEKGISTILFHAKTNEDIPTMLKRCATWLEVEEYLKGKK